MKGEKNKSYKIGYEMEKLFKRENVLYIFMYVFICVYIQRHRYP